MNLLWIDEHILDYRAELVTAIASRVEHLTLVAGVIGGDVLKCVDDLPNVRVLGSSDSVGASDPRIVSPDSVMRLRRRTYSSLRGMSLLAAGQVDSVLLGNMGLSLPGLAAARSLGSVKLVVWARLSEHTEAGVSRARTAYRRTFAQVPDAWLVNGQSGRRYVNSLNVDPGIIQILPQAPPNLPRMVCQRERAVLYVGRLVEGKGVEDLLASQMKAQFPLTVVGGGPLSGLVRQREGRGVRYLGWLSAEALAREYARHRALAFPSHKDEWGLVALESLRLGTPVVGSPYSQAVAELVIDGSNGWVVHPDDHRAMCDRLLSVLDMDPVEFAGMSQRAVASVAGITTEEMANTMLASLG